MGNSGYRITHREKNREMPKDGRAPSDFVGYSTKDVHRKIREMAERLNPLSEVTVRCAHCPAFTFTGTAGEARDVQRAHVETHHHARRPARRRDRSFSEQINDVQEKRRREKETAA